jgi:uncharacterized protein YkwD
MMTIRHLSFFLLSAVACSEADFASTTAALDTTSPTTGDISAPATDDDGMTVTLDTAYGTVEVSLTSLTPYTPVWLAYGTQPSDAFCGDQFGGLCLNIDAPQISAEQFVDETGSATLTVEADRFALSHLVQAVTIDENGQYVATPISETFVPAIPDKPCVFGADLTEVEAMECEVVALVNEMRHTGLDCGTEGVFGPANPLTMQPQLMDAARVHSAWMAVTDNFSHTSPDGPYGDTMVERVESAGYMDWQRIAENIAFGQKTAAAVVNAWAESDGHCKNLMNPHLEHIGVGLIYSDNGRPYWTQDFGTEF